jgi:hypothetical protein
MRARSLPSAVARWIASILCGLMDRFVFDPSWLGDVPPPRRPLLLFDGG